MTRRPRAWAPAGWPTLPGTVAAGLAERTGAEVVWQVVAEPGSSTLRVHHRLLAQVGAADVMVLSVGMNDLIARHTTSEWRDEMSSILDLLAPRVRQVGEVPGLVGGARRLVVCGCPPVRRFPRLRWPLSSLLDDQARRFDEVTRELCAERGVTFVGLRELQLGPEEFASDGFHPNDSGYRRWAGLLVQALTDC